MHYILFVVHLLSVVVLCIVYCVLRVANYVFIYSCKNTDGFIFIYVCILCIFLKVLPKRAEVEAALLKYEKNDKDGFPEGIHPFGFKTAFKVRRKEVYISNGFLESIKFILLDLKRRLR